MAGTLNDLLGGSVSADVVGSEIDITGGIYTLMWSGTLTGGSRILIEFQSPLGSDWHTLDDLLHISAASDHATNFIIATCKVRASLVGANGETNVAAGIFPVTGGP